VIADIVPQQVVGTMNDNRSGPGLAQHGQGGNQQQQARQRG